MPKPTVIVFQQASLDGRLTISPESILLYGEERWNAIAGQDASFWLEMRSVHQPQATLEGSGSFVPEAEPADRPPAAPPDPTDEWLYEDYLPANILNRPNARGWFTAVDGRGRIRWAYKEFPSGEWQGWYPLVLVCRRTPAAHLAYLRSEEVPYLVAGDAQVDLPLACEKLNTCLGVTTLLSSAGGRLNGALLRAGLVDEVDIDFVPALIGGTRTSSLFTAPDLGPEELPTPLRLIEARPRPDGHLLVRYAVAPRLSPQPALFSRSPDESQE